MAWLAPYAYLAGLGVILGATIYSEMLDRRPTDDPLSDGAHGDWVALPDDFKTLFHATETSRGGQPHHVSR